MSRKRILHGAVAFVLAIASVAMLADALKVRPLRDLAAMLERAEELPAIGPETLGRVTEALAVHRSCERTVSRSRVTGTLFLLRRAAADGESFDTRLQRFIDARDAIAEALECSPLDGNLWILSAWLAQTEAFEPGSFRARVEMSMRTAPHEAAVLYARSRLLAPLAGTPGFDVSDPGLRRDLVVALALLAPDHARQIHRMLSGSLGEAGFLSLAAELSNADRDKLLAPAVRPVRPSRSERFRRFEFNVF